MQGGGVEPGESGMVHVVRILMAMVCSLALAVGWGEGMGPIPLVVLFLACWAVLRLYWGDGRED